MVEKEGYLPWSDVVNVPGGRGVTVVADLLPVSRQVLGRTHTVFADGVRLNVTVWSDCVVSRFGYSDGTESIYFLASGPDGALGHANLTVPKALLSGEYVVRADGGLVQQGVVDQGAYAFVYFEFPQGGQRVVTMSIGEMLRWMGAVLSGAVILWFLIMHSLDVGPEHGVFTYPMALCPSG